MFRIHPEPGPTRQGAGGDQRLCNVRTVRGGHCRYTVCCQGQPTLT